MEDHFNSTISTLLDVEKISVQFDVSSFNHAIYVSEREKFNNDNNNNNIISKN